MAEVPLLSALPPPEAMTKKSVEALYRYATNISKYFSNSNGKMQLLNQSTVFFKPSKRCLYCNATVCIKSNYLTFEGEGSGAIFPGPVPPNKPQLSKFCASIVVMFPPLGEFL